MKPVKRSFSIAGHRTSISLEAAFWEALKEVARGEGKPVAAVVAEIDRSRGGANLSSAVRVWLLDRYRRAAAVSSADKGT
ncbi:MAG: ribbon-helix-helix domain-containing protein [Hyphomicrobiaceae bacterium]|jgi:predicted DNA-binding ribbon-helix-helix protein